MELKDRIAKIGEFFDNMEITTVDEKQVIYVGVSFPKGWMIDESINEKYNVSVIPGNDGLFYFACDINDGTDNVFDAIDYNISKMRDAIERAKLLTEKTMELKALFEDENNSVESLKSLKFIFTQTEIEKNNNEILIPSKKRVKNKQNNNTEETKEIENE